MTKYLLINTYAWEEILEIENEWIFNSMEDARAVAKRIILDEADAVDMKDLQEEFDADPWSEMIIEEDVIYINDCWCVTQFNIYEV